MLPLELAHIAERSRKCQEKGRLHDQKNLPRKNNLARQIKCCPKAVDVVSKKKRQSRRLCLSQPNLRKNVLALRAVAHLAVTLKAVAKHLDTACERVRLVLSLRVVQIVLLLFHNLFTLK